MANRNSRKNLLICLEGGDGAGKGTQADLLLARLREVGAASLMSFPDYKTPSGELVGELLAGKHWDLNEMDPRMLSAFYALNRAGAKEKLLNTLSEGHVILNRYVGSNMAYQVSRVSGEHVQGLLEFLYRLEFGELGLPKPDVVIFLDVEPEISAGQVGGKEVRDYLAGTGHTADVNERDTSLQARVYATHQTFVSRYEKWHSVQCLKDQRILPPEKIHELVWEVVEPLIS